MPKPVFMLQHVQQPGLLAKRLDLLGNRPITQCVVWFLTGGFGEESTFMWRFGRRSPFYPLTKVRCDTIKPILQSDNLQITLQRKASPCWHSRHACCSQDIGRWFLPATFCFQGFNKPMFLALSNFRKQQKSTTQYNSTTLQEVTLVCKDAEDGQTLEAKSLELANQSNTAHIRLPNGIGKGVFTHPVFFCTRITSEVRAAR